MGESSQKNSRAPAPSKTSEPSKSQPTQLMEVRGTETVKTVSRQKGRNPVLLFDIFKDDLPAFKEAGLKGFNKMVVGDRVARIRKTKKGKLLVKVRSDETAMSIVRA